MHDYKLNLTVRTPRACRGSSQVLVKYDDAATYADYMIYIASNTSNVVAFKQAPTNCVELDDIQDANITARQAIIMECRKNRMIK